MLRPASLAAALLLAAASAARACPVCSTTTGQEVRAGIFNDAFLSTLLLTAAPFPLFLTLVALLHFGLPARKSLHD